MPSSAKVISGFVSFFTMLETTSTSPVLEDTTVPLSSILAVMVDTISFVAIATPPAPPPAPVPAPATMTIRGLVVANTLTSPEASTVAPSFIFDSTILRIKLIDKEPAIATPPAPLPPIEMLIMLALASEKTLTPPSVTLTEEFEI